MSHTYVNCYNLSGNAYIYSNNITDTNCCFLGRNSSKQLNIYVHANTNTNTIFHSTGANLVGDIFTLTNAGTYSYNTAYNIYIYPVANVEASRIANGDPDNMGNL
jgi:hypothetical protein